VDLTDLSRDDLVLHDNRKGKVTFVYNNWYGTIWRIDIKLDDGSNLILTTQSEFDGLERLDSFGNRRKKISGCTCGAIHTSFPDYHLHGVCDLWKENQMTKSEYTPSTKWGSKLPTGRRIVGRKK